MCLMPILHVYTESKKTYSLLILMSVLYQMGCAMYSFHFSIFVILCKCNQESRHLSKIFFDITNSVFYSKREYTSYKIHINIDSLRVHRSVRPSLYPLYSQNCLHILSKVFRSTARQPTQEVGSIRCGSSRIQKNY